MTEPLRLKVGKPAVIRSWRDLVREAEALAADATQHGYGGWRSRRLPYCACVKVGRSWGDLDISIGKLNPAPSDAVIDAVRDEFTAARIAEQYWSDWIQDSSEYLVEWFEGVAHGDAGSFAAAMEHVRQGRMTHYPTIDELPTRREKLARLRSWIAEDRLFVEALAAAGHARDSAWEGRSSGYFTWSACSDVENGALDVVHRCDPDLQESFHDVLRDFREIERIHLLNLALIDYLEQWAKRMDFQNELDCRVETLVTEEYDRIDSAAGTDVFSAHANLLVTLADSHAAGNCRTGTAVWAAQHFPGRTSATVAEIMAVGGESSALARRACRYAMRRADEEKKQVKFI